MWVKRKETLQSMSAGVAGRRRLPDLSVFVYNATANLVCMYKRKAVSGILSDVLGCVCTRLREAEEDYKMHANVQARLCNVLV